MRLFGIFITACVVLAAAQAVAMALCLLLIAGLIYGLFVAPRETLGLLGMLFVGGLFQLHPLAFLGVLALLMIMRCRA